MTRTIVLTLVVPDDVEVEIVSSPRADEPPRCDPPEDEPAPAEALDEPEPRAKRGKYTPAQLAVLNALADQGGLIVDRSGRVTNRLMALAGVTFAAPQTVLRKFEQRGLVQREVNGTRSYLVRLTKAGWALIGREPSTIVSAPPPPPPTAEQRPARMVETPPAPRPDVAPPSAAPQMPQCGPIERRPFDPDEVRAQQAHALDFMSSPRTTITPPERD